MKYILSFFVIFFTISSTMSASFYANYVYISNGDSPPNINYTTTDHLSNYADSNTLHSYNGPDLVESGDYSGVILNNAYLKHAWLRFTDFSGANLSHAYMGSGYFYNSDFVDSNLSNSSMDGGNFSNADFTDADLSGASLVGTRLGGANFTNADLTNASFDNASSIGMDLKVNLNTHLFEGSETTIVGNWNGAILTGAVLPRGYDQAWFEGQGAVFEAVPEPSSYALLLGGLALGLVALRRR